MDKILSIIIPAYNMEKYLEQCVLSIARSKFIDNIEIVIVNDGSCDGTLGIAQELEKQYPQSIKVIDKTNGGHGSTINCGAYQCVGKYFKVVDADDWVDTNELDKLVNELFGLETDCVICNYTEFFECENKTKLKDVTSFFSQGIEISIEEYVRHYRLAMHSVTYKTHSYRLGKIMLTEKCFYVDTQFIYYPLSVFENVVCFHFNVYQYRLQRAGQSVSREGFFKHINDHRTVLTALCDFYNSFSVIKDKLKEYLASEIGVHLSYHQNFLISKNLQNQEWLDYKVFINKIKRLSPEVYKKMPLKRRVFNNLPASTVRLVATMMRRA